jgi:protocatechuate 3,4-dioxygenase beta subunit
MSFFSFFSFSEGKPGIPFRLSIAVIDTNNCTPLVKALVDLWHCDADGIYSHYIAASQGISGAGNDNQTFFRGMSLLIRLFHSQIYFD